MLGLDLAKEIRRLNKYSNSDEISQKYSPVQLKCLILDFSALSYIDPSGTTSLKLLIKEFNKLDILVYLAGSSCKCFFLKQNRFRKNNIFNFQVQYMK